MSDSVDGRIRGDSERDDWAERMAEDWHRRGQYPNLSRGHAPRESDEVHPIRVQQAAAADRREDALATKGTGSSGMQHTSQSSQDW